MATCTRCKDKGYTSYKHIKAGRCFLCNISRVTLTHFTHIFEYTKEGEATRTVKRGNNIHYYFVDVQYPPAWAKAKHAELLAEGYTCTGHINPNLELAG
jgi:hypothetical protein